MPANLEAIKNKVRLITRSPDEAALSNEALENYINDFVLYDFPEHLRLFSLKTTLTFFTGAFKDTYKTDSQFIPELADFKNQYITVHPPVYIAGRKANLYQSRDQFFNKWPLNEQLSTIATGDGVVDTYAGFLSDVPVLQNNVSFTSANLNGDQLVAKDVPTSNIDGELQDQNGIFLGFIQYNTGEYDFTFSDTPANGQIVQAQTKPYQPSIPFDVLYYDNEFTFRPVPDKSYRVNIEVYKRPTALIENNAEPELQQWWQYIAYGASKKVFEDRMDLESVQLIMPEFLEQQTLVERRTIVQRTNDRTSTIYNSGLGMNGTGYDYYNY